MSADEAVTRGQELIDFYAGQIGAGGDDGERLLMMLADLAAWGVANGIPQFAPLAGMASLLFERPS